MSYDLFMMARDDASETAVTLSLYESNKTAFVLFLLFKTITIEVEETWTMFRYVIDSS